MVQPARGVDAASQWWVPKDAQGRGYELWPKDRRKQNTRDIKYMAAHPEARIQMNPLTADGVLYLRD